MNKQAKEFKVGDVVTVSMGHERNGHFAPDGHEGKWYVVGYVENDLKLARRIDPQQPLEDQYDVFIHVSRVREAGWYSDARQAPVLPCENEFARR